MQPRSMRVVVAAALAAVTLNSTGATGQAGAAARAPELRAVSAGSHGATSRITIEASEPVAYLTSHPDPLTVLVDLRNVRAARNAPLPEEPAPPVSSVRLESVTAADGAPVTRVRVNLARVATYEVRSARNVIFVDVDPAPATGPSGAAPDTGDPAAAGPAAAPALATASAGADRSARPAPAAGALAQQASGGAAAAARFTGEPVTLDFQNADLRAVLRTFAEISGLNIVIDPAVGGAVDVALRDVPWDQALDIILKANKLGYAVDGTVVRIAPLQVLEQEERQRRALADAQANAGELQLIAHPLSYARAQELVPIITRSALSSRGEVQIDSRTNTLIIRDLPERLEAATELIRVLDRAQPQVEIEARIVRSTTAFVRELGVQWGLAARMDPALGNTSNLAFPNSGSIATGVNVGPGGAPTGTIGLALGSVNGAVNLDMALSALEASGKGRVLSTPRISTQNNVEAEISQGTQIPIQTVANNTVTVQFKDATLTLRVTPQITAANTVIMRISVENSSADFSKEVNGIPPIDTQRANTSVLVGNGETTVIGGIYVSSDQTSNRNVPALHRVPLLGWLFRTQRVSDTSEELLIFITPRISQM